MYAGKTNPCKDCQYRAVGCHSDCGSYKEWRLNLDRRNEQINKSKQMYNLLEHNPQIAKFAKRRRRKKS